MRLLHLNNFDEWITSEIVGFKAVELNPMSRTHFYVHCDCIENQHFNNRSSNVIRTIVNKAPLNEQVILSFDNPRYYRVSRNYFGNINMYITDGLHEDILKFNPRETVSFDLHFRQW